MSAHVDDLLPELVMGTLIEADRARVEAHVAQCDRCRGERDATQELFATLALAEAPIAPSPAVWQRLAASTERGRFAEFAAKVSELLDLTLDKAREVLEKIEQPSAWQPIALAGVTGIRVSTPEVGPRLKSGTVGFLRIKPGARFPGHIHHGPEWQLTLQGGYIDEVTGHEFGPGELQQMAPGTSHSFIGAPGPDCICLGVVDGKLEMVSELD